MWLYWTIYKQSVRLGFITTIVHHHNSHFPLQTLSQNPNLLSTSHNVNHFSRTYHHHSHQTLSFLRLTTRPICLDLNRLICRPNFNVSKSKRLWWLLTIFIRKVGSIFSWRVSINVRRKAFSMRWLCSETGTYRGLRLPKAWKWSLTNFIG